MEIQLEYFGENCIVNLEQWVILIIEMARMTFTVRKQEVTIGANAVLAEHEKLGIKHKYGL